MNYRTKPTLMNDWINASFCSPTSLPKLLNVLVFNPPPLFCDKYIDKHTHCTHHTVIQQTNFKSQIPLMLQSPTVITTLLCLLSTKNNYFLTGSTVKPQEFRGNGRLGVVGQKGHPDRRVSYQKHANQHNHCIDMCSSAISS